MEDKDFEDIKIRREIGIRRKVTMVLGIILVVAIIVFFSLYIAEENFRNWVDINVLRKNITNQDVGVIDLDTDKNNQIFCYGKNICILNDKNLKIYNQSGQNVTQIAVDINSAIFSATDKYLAVAEKNGQEISIIYDKTFLWREKVDGEILQVQINRNGYVALVTTDTTFKSIIMVYDSNGKLLLKHFLASTRVVDVSISNDNKYVSFAELDTSGALIKSNIKTISIEKALENPDEAIIYTYEADTSKMIVNIQYQDKGKLVCVYDSSVDVIKQENKEEILTIDNNITFVSGDFSNSICYVTEETKGIFNINSTVYMINTSNNQKSSYRFEEVAKEMYANDSIICINIGNELYFIGTNGNLIKKYTSNQEITNVLLSNDLGLVIYKDRVEIINL